MVTTAQAEPTIKRYLVGAVLLAVGLSTTTFADDVDDCVEATGDTQITGCTRVIESGRYQGASLAEAYYNRGFATKTKGDLDGAIADFARARDLEPTDLDSVVWLYLARTRSGRDGKEGLATDGAKFDSKKWRGLVVSLYLGKSTPDVVLKGAESPDLETRNRKLCSAHFYVGEWYALKGKRTKAVELLHAVRDRCPNSSTEYMVSTFELKRLGDH